MTNVELPEGQVLAHGHVYKLHYAAGVERVTDVAIAEALSSLGVVRVEHVINGGTEVVVTPTITKENA